MDTLSKYKWIGFLTASTLPTPAFAASDVDSGTCMVVSFGAMYVMCVIVSGFIALDYRNRERNRNVAKPDANQLWRAAALEFGLGSPKGCDQPMIGSWRGYRARVEIQTHTSVQNYDGQSVRKTTHSTCLELHFSRPLHLGLHIKPKKRSSLFDVGSLFGVTKKPGANLRTFDESFVLEAHSPKQARQLLFANQVGGSPADLLRSLKYRHVLWVCDDSVTIILNGCCFEAALLRRMLDDLHSVARALDTAQYGIVLPWRVTLANTWARYASQHGLSFNRDELCLEGYFKGCDVRLSMNVSTSGPKTRIQVNYPAPLGVYFRVIDERPAWVLAALGRVDTQVGEVTFDRRFTVHSDDPERALKFLNYKRRSALMKIAESAVTFEVNDVWVAANLKHTLHQEPWLDAVLSDMTTFARGI